MLCYENLYCMAMYNNTIVVQCNYTTQCYLFTMHFNMLYMVCCLSIRTYTLYIYLHTYICVYVHCKNMHIHNYVHIGKCP